ncbi:MAG: acetyl-CoA carboxylase carboxyl transferase subunit alpha [Rhodospirillaceae bacterium]|nr:MAG: acetyl-CoA carboxylase carboxyl transferase subunit alpha [Rhodospirillaceae bacterium]
MPKPLYLDFEQPVAELEGRIEELRHLSGDDPGGVTVAEEVARLKTRMEKQIRLIYGRLTPWQRTQVARHPERPHCLNYINGLIENFTPLAGDRIFGEDTAITGGLGRFRGRSVMVLGHEKGHDTESRVHHAFGMPRPEGYRKAERLMRLADHFKLPVITLIDTAGAYPDIEAEARGQARAIACCLETCLDLRVPFISVIIGEGGSGGALALAAANTVLMLENAVYSVISPEGCAAALWPSGGQVQMAAEALRLTATDLLALGVVDAIVPEPLGGAHRTPAEAIANVETALNNALRELTTLEGGILRARRREKFLRMGREPWEP